MRDGQSLASPTTQTAAVGTIIGIVALHALAGVVAVAGLALLVAEFAQRAIWQIPGIFSTIGAVLHLLPGYTA